MAERPLHFRAPRVAHGRSFGRGQTQHGLNRVCQALRIAGLTQQAGDTVIYDASTARYIGSNQRACHGPC